MPALTVFVAISGCHVCGYRQHCSQSGYVLCGFGHVDELPDANEVSRCYIAQEMPEGCPLRRFSVTYMASPKRGDSAKLTDEPTCPECGGRCDYICHACQRTWASDVADLLDSVKADLERTE